jgi:hypothetical protein
MIYGILVNSRPDKPLPPPRWLSRLRRWVRFSPSSRAGATTTREEYRPIQFQSKTLARIEQANAILAEYTAAGLRVILRQLFYQHVARGLIPNTVDEYKHLSRDMVHARDAGLSDWDAIDDRSREFCSPASWRNPDDFLSSVVPQYAEDLWVTQKYYPVVMIEKDALVGVIEPVCSRLRVPYFAIRGNVSQIPIRDAGMRMADVIEDGRIPVVLYLGDHDPSGIDITRDLEERLNLYARQEIEVRRIALTMKQIRRYRLPPNPAKESDTNLTKYVREFGTHECWELDALSPTVLEELISTSVTAMIDEKQWAAAERRERQNRNKLERMISKKEIRK